MAKKDVCPRTREKRELVLANFIKSSEYVFYKVWVKEEDRMDLPNTCVPKRKWENHFFEFKEHVRDTCIKELSGDIALLEGHGMEKIKESS